jgi:hypothetical protein
MRALYKAWLKWRKRADPTDARRGLGVLPRVLGWAGPDGVKLRDRAVASVTAVDCETYRSHRSEVVSAQVVGIETVMLRRLLNFAVARGDIEVSPMRLILLPVWNPRVKAPVPRALRPGVRPQSFGARRLSLPERLELEELTGELRAEGNLSTMPRTRAACPPAGAPCPFVSCRHHLAVEVERRGPRESIKLNFPGRDVDEIPATCSLQVAEAAEAKNDAGKRGQPGRWEVVMTIEEVAKVLNLTRERVNQVEATALEKFRAALPPDLLPA